LSETVLVPNASMSLKRTTVEKNLIKALRRRVDTSHRKFSDIPNRSAKTSSFQNRWAEFV
jgi:hypothetical protein